jgi:hypothetical protein
MKTKVSIKSFYSYQPEGNTDNLIKNLIKDGNFIKPEDFTFKKNKKLISKNTGKEENIIFKKDDKIFSFKKFIDRQIGLDLKDLIKNRENKNMINGISAKEEDYPSDEEELQKASKKCMEDLENAFDELNKTKLENLFYFNACKSKLKIDSPIKNFETHLLNTPEIETYSSQSEIFSSNQDDD